MVATFEPQSKHDQDAIKILRELYNERIDTYRSPKGYCSWNAMLVDHLKIALQSLGLGYRANEGEADKVTLTMAVNMLLNNPPTKYIGKEMCESFLRTKYPEDIGDLVDILPYFNLFVPSGTVMLENDELLYLSVKTGIIYPGLTKEKRAEIQKNYMDRSAKHITVPEELEQAKGIIVVGYTNKGYITAAKLVDKKIEEKAKECHMQLFNSEKDYHEYLISDDLIKDSDSEVLWKIVINSLLTYKYEPELVTADSDHFIRSGTGFGISKGKQPLPITWIGKNFRYQRQSNPGNTPGDASRAPSRPHWRRGHWHTVKYGKERSESRLAWFRPVFVNAKH